VRKSSPILSSLLSQVVLAIVALWISLFCVCKLKADDLRFGLPVYGYNTSNNEMYVGYDPMTHNPRFVLELITDEILKSNVPREFNPFHPNPALPDEHRVSQQDYIGIGYDRGHMAPAANHQSSRDSLYFTFQMDNIAPQIPELNRGIWAGIEKSVRDKYRLGGYLKAWVVTIPIYYSTTEELNIKLVGPKVWVPTHFAKSCLFLDGSGKYSCVSYMVPNERNLKAQDYTVTVDEIEIVSGLDLWVSLPKTVQSQIESSK